MAEGIIEYLKNVDLIDYLGLLTSIMIVVAYVSGGFYMIYNFFATKFGKVKAPADPYYDPRDL
jgi:hypothetical protein